MYKLLNKSISTRSNDATQPQLKADITKDAAPNHRNGILI